MNAKQQLLADMELMLRTLDGERAALVEQINKLREELK